MQSNQFGRDVGLTKGIIYHLMGNDELSRQSLLQQVAYEQANEPTGTYVDAFSLGQLATSWSYLGEHEKALETVQKAELLLPRDKDHIFGSFIFQAHTLVLARAGKRDEALERLAARLGKPEGYSRWALYLDPNWDFFRDDERFNELVQPLNLQEVEK